MDPNHTLNQKHDGGKDDTRKTARTCLLTATFSFLLFSTFLTGPARAIITEYLTLTCRGNDMIPAICDGDTVKVKICTNGTLIHAGPKNSTSPGDIIVYCAAAAVSVPQYMWMCGRTVDKYRKNGEWYFKTQIDSSPDPDAWEVPEHYLLGVVTEVTRGASPQDYHSTSVQPSNQGGPSFNIMTFAANLLTGIIIGAFIGATAAKAYTTRRRDE